MFRRVAIIGLGLIGGSIGLALHKAKAAQHIAGFDLGVGVCAHARKLGVIDQPCSSLADAVQEADLVILATPVGAMRALLQNISGLLAPGAVVTDVASTKAQVITWAEEFLPEGVSFVGGHPMAGKELSGVAASDADLFRQRIYCVTPTPRTNSIAIGKITSLVEILGARLRFLEPAEHDGLVASVSHLPFLASIALMEAVADSPTWGDASLLASTGFRDVTRLAAGSPEMYRDICLTNSEAITRWLDEYIITLQQLRTRIAVRDKTIGELFTHSQQARQQWSPPHNGQDCPT